MVLTDIKPREVFELDGVNYEAIKFFLSTPYGKNRGGVPRLLLCYVLDDELLDRIPNGRDADGARAYKMHIVSDSRFNARKASPEELDALSLL